MRVVLIYPPNPFLIDQKSFSPLGILYVASALLNKGIDVEVVDLSNKENCLEESIKNLSSPLFGISASAPQYQIAKKIVAILKRQNPKAKVIIGRAYSSIVLEGSCKFLNHANASAF